MEDWSVLIKVGLGALAILAFYNADRIAAWLKEFWPHA
jgi:hypothetical protein